MKKMSKTIIYHAKRLNSYLENIAEENKDLDTQQ